MPASNLIRCRACDTPCDANDLTNSVCRYCNRDYFVCSDCDNLTNSNRESLLRDGVCDRCAPDNRGRFSFTPIGEPPFIGTELEVEATSANYASAKRETLRALPSGFVTLKDDGSLSEYGFEIVSRPASYSEHLHAWPQFFAAIANGTLGEITSWSNDTCGLHVHICRDSQFNSPFAMPSERWKLDQHAQALIVCFVNLPRNRRFIETIAGRDANSYCGFFRKHMRNASVSTGNKYEAVNLNHAATLEFRIFKGTLFQKSFFKAIEFVLALSEFCRSTYNVRKVLALNQFIAFVSANYSTYPHLDSFIANRWYGKRDRNGNAQWRLKNNRKPPLPPIDHGNRNSERSN